jgi:hypothetical protein
VFVRVKYMNRSIIHRIPKENCQAVAPNLGPRISYIPRTSPAFPSCRPEASSVNQRPSAAVEAKKSRVGKQSLSKTNKKEVFDRGSSQSAKHPSRPPSLFLTNLPSLVRSGQDPAHLHLPPTKCPEVKCDFLPHRISWQAA